MGLFSNYLKSTINTKFYIDVDINRCDKSVNLDELQLKKKSGFLRTIVLHISHVKDQQRSSYLWIMLEIFWQSSPL